MQEVSESLTFRDAFLNLPCDRNDNVFFGLQRRIKKTWQRCGIHLYGRYIDVKRFDNHYYDSNDFEQYGVIIGYVRKYDDYGEATLFMGQHRGIYTMSKAGSLECDSRGSRDTI